MIKEEDFYTAIYRVNFIPACANIIIHHEQVGDGHTFDMSEG